jgi:hypothetical protein
MKNQFKDGEDGPFTWIEFVYKFSSPPDSGTYYNLLLAVEDSVMLLAAS